MALIEEAIEFGSELRAERVKENVTAKGKIGEEYSEKRGLRLLSVKEILQAIKESKL